MSKRDSAQMAKGGKSIFLTDLEELGYIPEAIVNWLSLMGWSYDDRTDSSPCRIWSKIQPGKTKRLACRD